MGGKLTYEEVKNFIEIESNSGCKLLTEEYIDNKVELKLLCKCGNEFEASFNKFKSQNKRQCVKCGREKTSILYDEAKHFIEIESNSGCKLLTMKNEYTSSRDKISIKCKCGNEFLATFAEFKNGKCGGKRQCNNCGLESRKNKLSKETSEFLNELYNIVGDEYICLEDYKNSDTKITFKHKNCGKTFKMKPINILSGNRCPHCSKNKKKTTYDIKEELKKLYNDEYECLGEYENRRSKILIKHNKCGHQWKVSPQTIQKGILGCPKCNESKGEKKIQKWLKDNNIYSKFQYRIKECKDKKSLPFDFAIFKDNTYIKLKFLIEYNGKQHYIYEEKMFGSTNSQKIFSTTKKHDKIKNNYCIKNNIKLICIPYWDFNNIGKILEDILIYNNLNSEYIINNNNHNKVLEKCPIKLDLVS